MNAFAEIEVTPLYSHDGMRSQGKSVRIADETAEKGWAEIGVVSPNYLLVHNGKAKEVVDQIVLILKSIFESGYLGGSDLAHLQNLGIEEKDGGFFLTLPNDFGAS